MFKTNTKDRNQTGMTNITVSKRESIRHKNMKGEMNVRFERCSEQDFRTIRD